MKRYSLNKPLEGHWPIVGRIRTGRTWAGGQCFGTTVYCSCGAVPNPTGLNKTKVTNEAPSAGGRSHANSWYREHVAEVLAATS